jgi:hypothetical protein
VTIQATVPQMSEIPEELMYYPVFNCLSHIWSGWIWFQLCDLFAVKRL